MFKKILIVLFLLSFASSAAVFSQQKTRINSNYARKKLIGRHFLSLQWISWDWLGRAYVRRRKGVYYLTGKQKGRGNDDSLEIDGVITEINRYNFKFKGKIKTRISHINDGAECLRDGDMIFAITKRRRYWRLQDIDNPCDTAADYVDIYFRSR